MYHCALSSQASHKEAAGTGLARRCVCRRPDERARRLEGFPAELQRRYAGRLYGFDQESALLYGVLMGHSRRQGRSLSTADGMIAAIALRHQGELATRNVDDFVLPNLLVHNPWTD